MVVCIDSALTYKCILNLLGLSLTEIKTVLIAGTFNPGFGSQGYYSVCSLSVLLKEQEHGEPELMVISDTGKYCKSTETTSVGEQNECTDPITSLPSHFHVQPLARLPCVTLSSSLVISGPGDSVCPSEGSGNVEWACKSSPVCVPMGTPLSSCGVPDWGCGELLIRQGACPVLSCPTLPDTKRGECCDLQETTDIHFQSLYSSLSSQKLAMFMEEIHC